VLGAETTLRAIRRASCPVLAVGPGLDAAPRTVVVATDFSPASARAAELVAPLLAHGATMHFVHVWQPIGVADPRTEALDDAYRVGLPARFDRLTTALALPPTITVRHEIREGAPVERILDFAEARRADLIVAGRHGLGVLERILVGSVTATLLRRAPCSLFVAPEPPFAEADRLRRLVSGASESRTPGEWSAQLDAFTRRNAGRRVALESDYPLLGAETEETGFAFAGAAYDPHDRRVELMFGGSGGGTAHLTRGITGIAAITVLTTPHGADVVLRIDHRDGQTRLRFLPA
jgi:nucleotide-binding universal stress UspA family protein